MLVADANLMWNMRIYQGIEKILVPYCKLYLKRKASTVQSILAKVFFSPLRKMLDFREISSARQN